MNAQQLKNAILQEAIEGRLVPQDPTDEPASALLERIRAEKERLVKEGKLKKKDLVETPIPEDEIPFEIPDSWEWCKLNDLCIFLSRGKSPSYSDLPNSFPVFAQKCNLKDGGISLEQARFLNPETVSKWPEVYRLRTDDVLVNSTGTGTVCRTRLFNERYLGKYPFVVPDSHVSVVRTSCNISSAFIYHLLNSKFYQDYWEDRLAGSTNQKELYIGVLQNTIIPLPPLAEQKRIVAKIEELLPKVEEYGKAQEALDKLNAELPDRLKKSVLQEAIEGRLVPQDPTDEPASVLLAKIRQEKEQLVNAGKLKKKDLAVNPISEDEIPFEIPESWEWVRLGAITTVLGGKRIPAGRKLSQNDTGHVYIRVSDMKDDTVSMDNLQYVPEDIFPSISRYIINKEDVFITVAGTIGRIGKIPSELDGANLTENADRLVFTIIDQDWLIKCLQSVIVQSQISAVTTQVGQPKLAILRIQNLLIPLPPLAEQKRIVKKLELLLGEIDKLKK